MVLGASCVFLYLYTYDSYDNSSVLLNSSFLGGAAFPNHEEHLPISQVKCVGFCSQNFWQLPWNPSLGAKQISKNSTKLNAKCVVFTRWWGDEHLWTTHVWLYDHVPFLTVLAFIEQTGWGSNTIARCLLFGRTWVSAELEYLLPGKLEVPRCQSNAKPNTGKNKNKTTLSLKGANTGNVLVFLNELGHWALKTSCFEKRVGVMTPF